MDLNPLVLWQSLQDYFVPRRCPLCMILVSSPGLCSCCWSQLKFISAPLCQRCGWPFQFHVGDQALCSTCLASLPPFECHRSALIYAGEARNLIVAFKRSGRESLIPVMGQWLLQAGRDILPHVDYCIPVPLHWSRLMRRGFNQAAVMARYIAQKTGIRYAPRALVRCRATPSQGGLGRKQRLANVRLSDFRLNPRALRQGASVLIMDDVYTTGATLQACCQALRQAGIKQVYALTVARVLPQDPGTL